MKSYEFKIKTTNDGTIRIPDNILKEVPEGRVVNIVISVDDEPTVKFRSTFNDISMQEFSQFISDRDAYCDDY
jgi:hypothetical protein